MTEPRAQYLPDQPSLRYPATKEEREERDEEDAYQAIAEEIGTLIDELKWEGFSREGAIKLINEVMNTEYKL